MELVSIHPTTVHTLDSYSLGEPRRPTAEVQIAADIFIRLTAWYPERRIRDILSPSFHQVLDARAAVCIALEQKHVVAKDPGVSGRLERHRQRRGQRHEESRLRHFQGIGHLLCRVRGRRAVDSTTCIKTRPCSLIHTLFNRVGKNGGSGHKASNF